MTRTWSIQEAKAHFSELLRRAETEPQVITRHGKEVARVVPPQGFEGRLPGPVLSALRGKFDFSDMPEDDAWLHLDRRGDLRPNPFEDDE